MHHFIMACPAHAKRRAALLDQVTKAAGRSDSAIDLDFGALPAGEKLLVILSKRVGDPRRIEDKVDWQALSKEVPDQVLERARACPSGH